MERGHEEHVVTGLQLISFLSFELPVCVVDEDEDPRSTVARH
jgi:hypothetical protein